MATDGRHRCGHGPSRLQAAGLRGEVDARRASRHARTGCLAVAVVPFAHAFYRIFGYELVTEDIKYRLKPADLPTSPEQSHLRAYQEEDLSSLMKLYEAEAKGIPSAYAGVKDIGKRRCPRKTRTSPSMSGTVREGYILYKISGWQDRDPRRTLSVEESPLQHRHEGGAHSFMAGLDPWSTA